MKISVNSKKMGKEELQEYLKIKRMASGFHKNGKGYDRKKYRKKVDF